MGLERGGLEGPGGGGAHLRVGVPQRCFQSGAGGGRWNRLEVFGGGRPDDGGLERVAEDADEPVVGAGFLPSGRGDGFAVVGGVDALGSPPLRGGLSGPLGRLVGVATVARVGGAELHGQVGARHAKAVVVTGVDDHVVFRRGVAAHALRGGRALLVPVMRGSIKGLRDVTLGTGEVAPGRFQGVRVVAIGAGDAGRVHLALQERAVFVDLVLDLSVSLIELRFQEGQAMGLGEWPPGRVALRECAAAGVAAGAGLDLGMVGAGAVSREDAAGAIHVKDRGRVFLEPDDKP